MRRRVLNGGVATLALFLGACAQAPESPAQRVPSNVNSGSISAASLVRIAEASRAAGDTASAARLFRRAIKIDPNHVAAQQGLGKTLLALDMPRAAIEHFRAAIAGQAAMLGKPGISSYNGLGVAFDTVGEHAAAQIAYRDGLVHHPENLTLRNNLGLSLALSGQHEDAIALLRAVNDHPSATARHRQNLALAYGLAGKVESAEETAKHDLDRAAIQNNLRYYAWLRERHSLSDSPALPESPATEAEPRVAAGPDDAEAAPRPFETAMRPTPLLPEPAAPTATVAATPDEPAAETVAETVADPVKDEAAPMATVGGTEDRIAEFSALIAETAAADPVTSPDAPSASSDAEDGAAETPELDYSAAFPAGPPQTANSTPAPAQVASAPSYADHPAEEIAQNLVAEGSQAADEPSPAEATEIAPEADLAAAGETEIASADDSAAPESHPASAPDQVAEAEPHDSALPGTAAGAETTPDSTPNAAEGDAIQGGTPTPAAATATAEPAAPTENYTISASAADAGDRTAPKDTPTAAPQPNPPASERAGETEAVAKAAAGDAEAPETAEINDPSQVAEAGAAGAAGLALGLVGRNPPDGPSAASGEAGAEGSSAVSMAAAPIPAATAGEDAGEPAAQGPEPSVGPATEPETAPEEASTAGINAPAPTQAPAPPAARWQNLWTTAAGALLVILFLIFGVVRDRSRGHAAPIAPA